MSICEKKCRIVEGNFLSFPSNGFHEGNFGSSVSTGTYIFLHREASASAQLIPINEWTTIQGWSVIEGDSVMLVGSKISISVPGKYFVAMNATTVDSGTATIGTRILKDGTDIVSDAYPDAVGTGTYFYPRIAFAEVDCSVGAYFEAQIKTGGAANLARASNSHPLFMAALMEAK